MVSLAYNWNNPAPVKGEESKLAQLLSEITQEDRKYLQERKKEFDRINTKSLELPESQDYELIRDFFHLLEDYCTSKIIENPLDSEQQLFYYRRLQMVYDLYDKVGFEQDDIEHFRKICFNYLERQKGDKKEF